MSDKDRELKLLKDLDALDDAGWLSMVRWMAPELCRKNNYLLAEMVIRRGQKQVESQRLSYLDADGKVERISLLFAEVGVKLVVAEPPKKEAAPDAD